MPDHWIYLPVALCVVSLLISMLKSGPIAWLKQQSRVVMWMGYLWAPMILLLVAIKLAGYW